MNKMTDAEIEVYEDLHKQGLVLVVKKRSEIPIGPMDPNDVVEPLDE